MTPAKEIGETFLPECVVPRLTPPLSHRSQSPVIFSCWKASQETPRAIEDLSAWSDEEPLELVADRVPYSLDEVNRYLNDGVNAFTYDLGKECVGHVAFSLTSEQGITIDISPAELLQNDTARPWIYRININYSWRYHTRSGEQKFMACTWTGARYLHVVLRSTGENLRFQSMELFTKSNAFDIPAPPAKSPELEAIFQLCAQTLELGAQEHLIDCPTREQSQYWGDAVFIAELLWRLTGRNCYLKWYLECFLHVLFREDGQISSVYPGEHTAFPDYSLIPILGQRFSATIPESFTVPRRSTTKHAIWIPGPPLRCCWYHQKMGELYQPYYDVSRTIRFNDETSLRKTLQGLFQSP